MSQRRPKSNLISRRNGLGSPFGIETPSQLFTVSNPYAGEMAWEARSGLKRKAERVYKACIAKGRNGLGSPFGIETSRLAQSGSSKRWRNGLGSPFGIETSRQLRSVVNGLRGEMAWEARSGLKPGRRQLGVSPGSTAKWPGKPVRD